MPRFHRLELESLAPTATSANDSPNVQRDETYWLQQADRERRQGNHENALRLYSRALEQNKLLVSGWLGQVQMLIFLGENPEADLWARKALELFKNQPDLLAARAHALCRRGDRSEARALCDSAFAQPGQSAYRWMVRGELMIVTDQDMDRYCFDKAALADPDWLVALEIAGTYRHYDQPSKALLYLRKALPQCPENAHIWLQQALCELDLGMSDPAQRSLRRCLELNPRHSEAATLLATVERGGWSVRRLLNRLFNRQ